MRSCQSLVALLTACVPLVGVADADLYLSEFVAQNASSRQDHTGDYCDWIEIRNQSQTAAASLAGWYLTDDPDRLRKWQFPAIEIAADGYLVVTADDDPAKGDLDASFQLDAAGEFLALVSPDGDVIDAIDPGYPPQLPDIAWGRTQRADGTDGWDFVEPTPGEANAVRAIGDLPPRIWDLTENPPQPVAGPEGESIVVSVKATPARLQSESMIAEVELFYRVNFDDEHLIAMEVDAEHSDSTYIATIPATAFAPGDMVRWRVEAETSAGARAKEPTFRLPRESPEYHGTVAIDPDIDSSLPVLHWYVENTARADRRSGTQASVFYMGRFYDNIFCRTRGQSTGNWPKPKYKFDFHKGRHFYWSDGFPKAEEFNLNSFLRGHTREPAMFTFLNAAGSRAPQTFYLRVHRNGDYYGLFGFVEQIDKRFLRTMGFDATGSLYKAAQVPATMARNPSASLYEKHLREDEPYTDLRELANGANVTNRERFDFFADHVNVPNYINVMAAMMLPFNHDQLTKNYYLYRDPHRGEWFRLPWDADQAFPTGVKNSHENWTSPLYGDRDHTQELQNNRPNPTWQNHLHANILDNPVTREMYTRRVRTLMDEFLALDPPEPEVVLLDGSKGASQASYIVPVDGSLESQWFAKEFNDSSWQQAPMGFGFEAIGDGYADVIATRVRPFETSTEATSIYLRVPFVVENPDTVEHWVLKVKYDDGFAAWINGTEVARANLNVADGELPPWNVTAISHPDADALQFEEFPLNAFHNVLVPGENVLALQIANVSAPSSDLMVTAEIVSGNPEQSGYFERLFESIEAKISEEAEIDRQEWRSKGVSIPTLASDVRSIIGRGGSLENRREQLFIDYATGDGRLIPDPQPSGIELEFGRVDANPASGIQDAEFIELINPNPFAVDVSGWTLEGGIEFTFAPGTVIASNVFEGTFQNRLYVTPSVRAFRERADFPLAESSRFVAGNYSGHLSNAGEVVQLISNRGELAATLETPPSLSPAQQFLRITEIMYHPADPHGRSEFIELTNLSETVSVDLAGVRFTEGVTYTFGGDAGILPPGASILLVEDAVAFAEAFGESVAAAVVGVFENGTGLSNGGESLKLEDAGGSTIVELRYNDKLPWPEAADGGGASLQLVVTTQSASAGSSHSWVAAAADPGVFAARTFQGDPFADNDSDGLTAMLEFVTGNRDDDASDQSWPLLIERNDGEITVSTRRNSAALALISMEMSSDLSSWVDADPALRMIDRSTDNLGIETRTFRVDVEELRGTFYLRLKLSVD